jgi:hypothetical protein
VLAGGDLVRRSDARRERLHLALELLEPGSRHSAIDANQQLRNKASVVASTSFGLT